MSDMRPRIHRASRVTAGILLMLAMGNAGTKDKAVRISLGEPSIWSLEQAHYLLESARRRNFSLRGVAPDKLDPNSINGARFDFLQTMLSVQGQYEQKIGVDNANARAKEPAINAKIAATQKDLDALNKQRDDLTAQLQSATSTDAISVIKTKRDDIDGQIKAKQDDLAKLAGSKALNSPGTGDKPNLIAPAMTDTITKLWKDLPADYRLPTLTATQQLDNYVSFGYELISKQLTQLRDEVGPGRRVVFLELPQSIDGVPGRAKDHWAQTWWRVSRAWFRERLGDDTEFCPSPQLSTIVGGYRQFQPEGTGQASIERRCRAIYVPMELSSRQEVSSRFNGPVRSIELIPSKQALTLTDIHAEVRQLGLAFIGKWLIGFGAKAEYNRTREKFDQFLTQQLYASSFGKGSATFGWTFRPMPNADSLEGGVRTTYAVLAIPENVSAIELEGQGCYYQRAKPPASQYPDELHAPPGDVRCLQSSQRFIVQIPDNSAGFYITDIDYQPVAPGHTITVVMRGSDISPQTGVLVNGVPLQQVLALSSPNQWRDANVDSDPDVKGQFEWVNSETLAMAFRMPLDFTGTPDIVLVSPAKSYSINRFKFRQINGSQLGACPPGKETFLSDYPCKMFKDAPVITSADITEWDGKKVYIDVQGRGFEPPSPTSSTVSHDHWFVNGKRAEEGPGKEETRTLISVDRPDETPWNIALVASRGKEQVQSRIRVDDPFAPVLSSVDPPKVKCEQDGEGRPFVTMLKVTGKGKFFNGSQTVELKDADNAEIVTTNLEPKGFTIQISQPDPRMVLVFNPADKKRKTVEIEVDRPKCPEP